MSETVKYFGFSWEEWWEEIRFQFFIGTIPSIFILIFWICEGLQNPEEIPSPLLKALTAFENSPTTDALLVYGFLCLILAIGAKWFLSRSKENIFLVDIFRTVRSGFFGSLQFVAGSIPIVIFIAMFLQKTGTSTLLGLIIAFGLAGFFWFAISWLSLSLQTLTRTTTPPHREDPDQIPPHA